MKIRRNTFFKIKISIISIGWRMLSLMPLRLLYVFSDILFYPVYYIVRYRRTVIRKNISSAFPEKSTQELRKLERGFYAFFCDYMMETAKQFTISRKEMMQRMTFEGIDDIVTDMKKNDSKFCFVYLGHYCNWEWVASLAYWVPAGVHCGQIYHPLRNKTYDRIFLRLRNRFGGENICMKQTLRRIVRMKKEGDLNIIGFISDQLPKWESIHHFTTFMNHDSAVFTGTEQIGKQVNAVIYYGEVSRPHRGYYHCKFKKITVLPREIPDYQLTDTYMQKLEQLIRQEPRYWLWSHDRWKRTKEEYIKRQNNKK